MSAYNYNKKNRRAYLRVFQYILSLAEERGYPHAEAFSAYFRRQDMQSPRTTERLMRALFEYVSPDEIKQMSRISNLS